MYPELVQLMRVEVAKSAAPKPVPPKLSRRSTSWRTLALTGLGSAQTPQRFQRPVGSAFTSHETAYKMDSAEVMSSALLCGKYMYNAPFQFAPRNRFQLRFAFSLLRAEEKQRGESCLDAAKSLGDGRVLGRK